MEIFAKIVICGTYRRLLRAAAAMGQSDHRLIKTIRNRFDTCYQLKIGVPNVEIFVEKYLHHYRVLGLHLQTWESFGSLCMLLVMLVSLSGGILSMFLGMDALVVFSGLGCGIVGDGILLLSDCLLGIENKHELLRIDMMDFLENVCKPRLENETFHPQMLTEYRQQYFDAPKRENKAVSRDREQEHGGEVLSALITKEEEEVLLDVIREYMG